MAKKTPLRMCIACRQSKKKSELLKVIKNKEGQIFVDTTQKMAGRGAYICFKEACHTRLNKQRLLNRAFLKEVDKQVYQDIENLYLDTKRQQN